MEICRIFSLCFIKNIKISATGTVKVFGNYSFIISKLRDSFNFVIFHYSTVCCSLVEEISTKTSSIWSVMSSFLCNRCRESAKVGNSDDLVMT
jgi:hypothetical protein